jgi:transcriptional regulator with XRE-family HTH domain
MSDKIFSKRLAKAMAQSGFTQVTLAKGAGVSQSAVSRWLGGSIPSLAVGIRLSTILNVAHEWLIGGLELPPELKFTEEMRQRLIVARLKEGLEISEMAKKTGWPEATFKAVEDGSQSPHSRTLAVMIDALNVEEKWILEGRGKMFKPESSIVLIAPGETAKRRETIKMAKAKADFLTYQAERMQWELEVSEKQIKADGEYRPRIVRCARKRIRWDEGSVK